MKFKLIHLFLAIAITAVAIAIYHYEFFAEDWRHGNGICDMHRVKMKTVVVNALPLGPAPQMAPEFYSAKKADFPNCHVDFGGDRRGRIYLCPICQNNYEAYDRKAEK